MIIPKAVLDEILERTRECWPNNRDMQEDFVKEEIDGYQKCQSIDFSSISKKQKDQMMTALKEKYDCWYEIASEIENEIKALKNLKAYTPPLNIPNKLFLQWKKEAAKENEGCFFDQFYDIKQKVYKYESIQKTRREIDPIKRLLIELENIVGNECYNGNIQNYSRWGELESEGRSFRYPVKFINEKGESKKKNVTMDILSEELITGYYPFGANELNIYRALHKILKHLEKNYEFNLPKT